MIAAVAFIDWDRFPDGRLPDEPVPPMPLKDLFGELDRQGQEIFI